MNALNIYRYFSLFFMPLSLLCSGCSEYDNPTQEYIFAGKIDADSCVCPIPMNILHRNGHALMNDSLIILQLSNLKYFNKYLNNLPSNIYIKIKKQDLHESYHSIEKISDETFLSFNDIRSISVGHSSIIACFWTEGSRLLWTMGNGTLKDICFDDSDEAGLIIKAYLDFHLSILGNKEELSFTGDIKTYISPL